MASGFPGSIDSFTNPLSTSALTSPSHSGQHTDLNDAITKIETKLGTGSPVGSAIGTWTNWSPTFTNVTVGNGTTVSRYTTINSVVILKGYFTLGSTSAITGAITMNLPIATVNNPLYFGIGQSLLFAGSAGGANYYGPIIQLSTTSCRIDRFTVAASQIQTGPTSATGPATWTTGNWFGWWIMYESA